MPPAEWPIRQRQLGGWERMSKSIGIGSNKLASAHRMALILAILAAAFCPLSRGEDSEASSTALAIFSTTTPALFDCKQTGQECLHDGICAMDGSNCDCSPSPNWFGPHCELRRCVQRHNPCLNGAQCEKTEQSFHCHCPIGFSGVYCEQQLPTICDELGESACQHGTCRIGATIRDYFCECSYGWTGPNCSEPDHCRAHGCLNGNCVNIPGGHSCECRPGWGGQRCELDVDECRAGGQGICQNGGKCQNLLGSFFCQCPAGFVGQFCERQNGPDQCQPSTCQNGGQCQLDIAATTANWAVDVKKFDWRWECHCPMGFEGPRCEQIVDDCALGRMTCVNGGQCVRPWLEEQFDANGTNIRRIWHPPECRCSLGFQGEFCEMDVNECEQYQQLCHNGATCMNRHGTYACMCVGGFEGEHCEHNIDDCVDNLCFAGSTCVDGISRYNCLCKPERVGNLCEFPNPCSGKPCIHGQCFADSETGNFTCQCEDGWQGTRCEADLDECSLASTNRCFNGQCVNTEGGFRCECELGYTDELCMSLVKYCDANPCQNGATCLNDLGRFDCICLPGYSGKHCEVHAYQELNKCFLECQNGGICGGPSAEQCECPAPYAGILCEIEKPDPCEQHRCSQGAICAPNSDYISYSCQCPPHLAGQFCERRLAPCQEGFNPCVHGTCQRKGEDFGEDFSCACSQGWTGPLCERAWEEEGGGHGTAIIRSCPLPSSPCQNGGQCIGGGEERGKKDSDAQPSQGVSSSSFFECICPRGFHGPLCEQKFEGPCGRGCRNGGKCVQKGEQWQCQCLAGFQGTECEEEKNACLNVTCKNKGKCVNLGGVDHRCDCAPGWAGEQCELNVDECQEMNIICLGGGKCVDRVANYRCECSRGYAGRHCEFSVPVDKFNRTDLVDLNNCRRQKCEQKAANGKCDPECNLYACKFDGGDCSTKQADPFEKCPQPSYCAHVFADGKCDEICNIERCLFDGFDCVPRPLAKCPRLADCALRYANGQCDQQCNMAACGWDGGDCDREAEPDPSDKPQILPGELMLVLAAQPKELFPNLLRQFLLSLSAHLRASLALSMDSEAKPKLFEWRSDSGIGTRIPVPPELNVTSMFSVHYGEEEEGEGDRPDQDGEGKSTRRRREAGQEDPAIVQGVAVFLRVDVTMCNLLDSNLMKTAGGFSLTSSRTTSPSHRLLGVHSPCFSDVHSVAAYVGAANAKKALQDIGVPILEARLAPREPARSSSLVFFLYLLSIGMVALAGSGVTVVVVKRQRGPRRKSAKTWMPPLYEQQQQSAKFDGSSSSLATLNHPQQAQLAAASPFCWPHFPVASAGSCASNGSNIPLMMSHAASMSSLCGQQQQQQQSAQNIYCSANASNPMGQMAFQQPIHPHFYGGYGQQQQQMQQLQHSRQQQQLFNTNNTGSHQFFSQSQMPMPTIHSITANTIPPSSAPGHDHHQHQQNAIQPGTSGTSCSRSSSSGIGGSSTEHSPLGHHQLPHHQQLVGHTQQQPVPPSEEEQAKRHLLAELRELAVLSPEGLVQWQKGQLEPWMVNASNERGRTLLHLLFQNGPMLGEEGEQHLLANIDLLFKAGVSVDAQDNDGSTALSLAVRNRKCLAVKKLVKECGADANLEDADDKTPLYHCCANLPTGEDMRIAEFLVREVEDVQLDTLAKGRETPLMRCAAICNEKSLKIAETILEKVEPAQRMEFLGQCGEPMLRTALHVAASVSNVDMIRLLVQNGANKEATDKEAKTPLFLATEQAQYDAIATLLELGADRNKTDLNETKMMEIASQPGFEAIVELFRQWPEQGQQHHHFQGRQQHLPPMVLHQPRGGVVPGRGQASEAGNGQKRQRTAQKRSAAPIGLGEAVPQKCASLSRPSPDSSCAPKKAAICPQGGIPGQMPVPSSQLGHVQVGEEDVSPPPQSGTGTSSSLLTPPNSDQSNYSSTPSPGQAQQALLASRQAMAAAANMLVPNSSLSMANPMQMPGPSTHQQQQRPVANLTVRQLAPVGQMPSGYGQQQYLARPNPPWMALPSSMAHFYGQMGASHSGIGPSYHRHNYPPTSANAIYAVPQQPVHPYTPGTSSTSAHHFGQASLTAQQPYFLSPQEDKELEPFNPKLLEMPRTSRTGPIDFSRSQLNFGGQFGHGQQVTSSALLGGGEFSGGGSNSQSNSLTNLEHDLSENELFHPKLMSSQELSDYYLSGGGGPGMAPQVQQQQQNSWDGTQQQQSSTCVGLGRSIPEQSSPEN